MSRDKETLIDIITAIKLIFQYSQGVEFHELAKNTGNSISNTFNKLFKW